MLPYGVSRETTQRGYAQRRSTENYLLSVHIVSTQRIVPARKPQGIKSINNGNKPLFTSWLGHERWRAAAAGLLGAQQRHLTASSRRNKPASKVPFGESSPPDASICFRVERLVGLHANQAAPWIGPTPILRPLSLFGILLLKLRYALVGRTGAPIALAKCAN
jgi:hypothetical protein